MNETPTSPAAPRQEAGCAAASCGLRRVLTSPWWVALLALLELVLGFVLLSFPALLGASAIWVAGFVLIAVGLMRLLQVFTMPGRRIWNLLAFLVYAFVGALMVGWTGFSLEVWTLAIGLALLFAGIMRLCVAIGLSRQPGSAWRYFNAVVSIVLGAMVCWGWPESSLWLIGTLIAVEMIFSGWTLLFLALAPRGNAEAAH